MKVNKYGRTPFRDVAEQVQSRKVERVEERLREHYAFVQQKGLAALSGAMHATNGLLRPFGGNPMVRAPFCKHARCGWKRARLRVRVRQHWRLVDQRWVEESKPHPKAASGSCRS